MAPKHISNTRTTNVESFPLENCILTKVSQTYREDSKRKVKTHLTPLDRSIMDSDMAARVSTPANKDNEGKRPKTASWNKRWVAAVSLLFCLSLGTVILVSNMQWFTKGESPSSLESSAQSLEGGSNKSGPKKDPKQKTKEDYKKDHKKKKSTQKPKSTHRPTKAPKTSTSPPCEMICNNNCNDFWNCSAPLVDRPFPEMIICDDAGCTNEKCCNQFCDTYTCSNANLTLRNTSNSIICNVTTGCDDATCCERRTCATGCFNNSCCESPTTLFQAPGAEFILCDESGCTGSRCCTTNP
eukprot:g1545.t1